MLTEKENEIDDVISRAKQEVIYLADEYMSALVPLSYYQTNEGMIEVLHELN